MNLILLDDFENESEIISKKLLSDKNEIDYVTNCQNLELSKYQNIYLFVNIKNNFASFEIQEFILNYNFKMNIILIASNKNMCDPFVSWIDSLVFYNKLSLNIFARVERAKLEDDIKIISEMINDTKKTSTEKVTIYTDGACSGNPGPGGWGAILMSGNKSKEISGFEPATTNNRMELTAIVKALSMLKKKCSVELYSDSAYVVNAINDNWITNWKANNWKNSEKEVVKNIELWQELDKLINFHEVKFFKVKGHSDNEYNNRCDELATTEIANNRIED